MEREVAVSTSLILKLLVWSCGHVLDTIIIKELQGLVTLGLVTQRSDAKDLKLQLEQMRRLVKLKDKEASELQMVVSTLRDQHGKIEEKVKLQQLQLNVKQSLLDHKHREADDLKCQLCQVMKQRHASHFGLHSLFPLLFLLLFLVHLWVFSDILPAVLGIRDCLLATP
ncbi:NUP116 [Symbiodinium natans]|uniref:NUP116 protein n=1 Tax=Symbiodinium natans TaxID=878477 RepID=A0A812KTZ4_9DINO|nr:NUP116 [Symbiodinium natans]